VVVAVAQEASEEVQPLLMEEAETESRQQLQDHQSHEPEAAAVVENFFLVLQAQVALAQEPVQVHPHLQELEVLTQDPEAVAEEANTHNLITVVVEPEEQVWL
jgi:hypothetical protein